MRANARRGSKDKGKGPLGRDAIVEETLDEPKRRL